MKPRQTPKPLESAASTIGPKLAAGSASLNPGLRRVVEYHWGWRDPEGNRIEARKGKALRPALGLLSAEAVGEERDLALSGAAAVEMLHDYTLLHDDVMDRDEERRGRPTAWVVFGTGAAICAGDALAALAQRVLLEDASPRREGALRALCKANEDVIAGQMLDASFEGRVDVSIGAYTRMASLKTGALLRCSASIGAILADGPEASIAALADFGTHLGLAFQAVDDWLGIWGDREQVGKPIGSDLRQRKASLPILHAAASSSAAGEEIRCLLRSDDPLSEEDVERATDCVADTGAGEVTVAVSKVELERAIGALDRAWLANHPRSQLSELAEFAIRRAY